jgi:membrane-associated HD superfamily phosphohydrolase
MDGMELVLLFVTIILVLFVFYASAAIVSQDWSASPEHLLRLLVVSLVFVFVVSTVSDIGNERGLSDLMLLLSFVVLIVVVRFILVEGLAVADDWLASIVISLMGVTLIFVMDALADALFDLSLPSII